LLTQTIIGCLSSYPWFSTALVAIGALRVIFLPLMTGLEMLATTTKTDTDDKAVFQIKKIGLFILDLVASIQIPPKN
jgi:hypothetical protein